MTSVVGSHEGASLSAVPVLYGSFSCPWCYLASQHSDQLTDLAGGPQWRMVDPDPHLPVAGLRLETPERERLQRELTAVGEALLPGEQLPAEAPAFLPNTGPAVVGYAEACGVGVGELVRRVLFDAYWQHGADIGDPEVLRGLLVEPILGAHSSTWPLRESGYAVTRLGGPVTSDAYGHIVQWQADWHEAAGDIVPAMVGGGHTLTGLDVITELRAIVLAESGAAQVALGDPATPSWVTARDTETAFLSTHGPVFEGSGSVSANGSIRPSISQPGKPDGEVAT